MSNEIALRDSFDLSVYQGPTGLEGLGADDISMPWLRIAAKNTDAAIEGSTDYIDGLKPGYFFNTLSKKVYGNSLKLIALRYFKSYAEHTAAQDGDFVRTVPASEVAKLTRVGTNYPLAGGHVVKESLNYLVALPEDPEAGILRFSLGPGAYKHVKNWNALMLSAKAPMWAVVWEVGTALSTSADGSYKFFSIGSDNTLVKRVGFLDPNSTLGKDAFEAFNHAKNFNPDGNPVASDDAGDAPF